MSGYNLPPGVSPGDIPGNGPADGAYERATEDFTCGVRHLWDYGFALCNAVSLIKDIWREYEAEQEGIYDSRREP